MVGIFARADHPNGWGYQDGRAHGYVVLFVRCANNEEIEAVAERLARAPFTGIPGPGQYSAGHLGEWFGGRFDHVATVPDGWDLPYGPFQCRGDNRMVAVYDAADILALGDSQGPAE